MSELSQTTKERLPISSLGLFGLAAGIGIYIYAWQVMQSPGVGILLGLAAWQFFYSIGKYITARRIIRKTEEMAACNRDEALNYLRYASGELKKNYRLRQYLNQWEERSESIKSQSNAANEAFEALEASSGHVEEARVDYVEEPPMANTEEIPRINRALVISVCLMPLVLLPFARQTLPCVGLWPALVIAVLSYRSLLKSDNEWKRRISILGLTLSITALVIFGLTLPANLLQGLTPKLRFDLVDHDNSWPVKIVYFLVLAISVILHECAHGISALLSGDNTADRHGRITLNPLAHVDLVGTIILPVMMMIMPGGVMFGWAKPVPVNPGNFRSRRKGMLATSVAGIGVNLFLAVSCTSLLMLVGVLLHFSFPGIKTVGFISPWKETIIHGVPMAFLWKLVIETLKAGISINMVLFSLNALPIPPLDGFGIIEGFMPKRVQGWMDKIRPIGSFLFIGLVILKVIDYLLLPGILIGMLFNFGAGYIAKLG